MTFSTDDRLRRPTDLPPGLGRMRGKWGTVVAFGVLMTLLGFLAITLETTATIASVFAIGVAMIVGGGVEIGVGFRMKTWGAVLIWELSGLLYLVAGAFAIANPVLASAVLTLMLGAGLIATGVVRLVMAFRLGGAARAMLALSSLVTILLGVVIVTAWPANSLFVLGLLIGVEMIFYGATWIAVGLRLRASA